MQTELVHSAGYAGSRPCRRRSSCPAAAQVMRCLDQFKEQHPGIRASGKSLVVHLVGHSLGGFLAEAVCVGVQDLALRHWQVRCTTFESTGLPPSYVDKALQRRPDLDYWKETMRTYLAVPNPINTLHKHLGSIVHIKMRVTRIATDVVRKAGFVCMEAQLQRVQAAQVAGAAGKAGAKEARVSLASLPSPPPSPLWASSRP